MFKILIYGILTLAGFSALAQNDTLFVKTQIGAIVGNTTVDNKKHRVIVQTNDKKSAAYPFDDIITLRSALGKLSITRIIDDQVQLLALLVQGEYSLLYHEKSQLFFVEQNDTLKIISRKHIHRALPLIFGQAMLDAFHKKMRVKPNYSFKYFQKLTTYANESVGAEQVVITKSPKPYRQVFSIGPYAGVALNKTIFILVKRKSPKDEFIKSREYKNTSIPLGISVTGGLTSRFDLNLDFYLNSSSIDVSRDSIGTYRVENVPSYAIFKKFDPIVRWDTYSFFTANFDLALKYNLTRPGKFLLTPWIMAGPGIAIMTENETKFSARFHNDETTDSYFYRWEKSRNHDVMVALTGGAGVDYALNKRLSMRLFAKIQRGIYPKLLHNPEPAKELNGTPAENSNFGLFSTQLLDRFEQYSRILSFGGSIQFKF